MSIESEWDRVNCIRSGWNKDVDRSWIVQTFDYWVLYSGLTKQEANDKVAEINALSVKERRVLFRKARGPMMAVAADKFELLLRSASPKGVI